MIKKNNLSAEEAVLVQRFLSCRNLLDSTPNAVFTSRIAGPLYPTIGSRKGPGYPKEKGVSTFKGVTLRCQCALRDGIEEINP